MLDMTLFEQRYGLKIRVQNPNPVELPITGMNFRLDINGHRAGTRRERPGGDGAAYGEAVVEIKLTSNLIRIFDQIRGLESGKGQSLRYHLSGGLSLANRMSKLPFDYQGEIGQRR